MQLFKRVRTGRCKSKARAKPAATKQRYPCDVSGCGLLFTRKYDVKRHKRTVHTGETPFACGTCTEKFKRPDYRQRHCEENRHSLPRGDSLGGHAGQPCPASIQARPPLIANIAPVLPAIESTGLIGTQTACRIWTMITDVVKDRYILWPIVPVNSPTRAENGPLPNLPADWGTLIAFQFITREWTDIKGIPQTTDVPGPVQLLPVGDHLSDHLSNHLSIQLLVSMYCGVSSNETIYLADLKSPDLQAGYVY